MPRSNFTIRTWAHVSRLLREMPILLEVVDSRGIDETRITRLETGFKDKLIIAATKSDMLKKWPKDYKIKNRIPVIHVSSKSRKGLDNLRAEIEARVKPKLERRPNVVVEILAFGIPNVGKSSLLNALVKKKIAKTGFRSGVTRGVQWIALDPYVRFVDAPGLIDIALKKEQLAMFAGVDAEKIKNPERLANEIIHKFLIKKENSLFTHFKIDKSINPEKVLESIAIKRGKLLKGGEPNVIEAAKIVIREWQKGKFSLK